jgi:hypothetical protein
MEGRSPASRLAPILHVSCAIVLIIGVLTRPDQTLLLRVGPAGDAGHDVDAAGRQWSPASRSIERSAPTRTSQPAATCASDGRDRGDARRGTFGHQAETGARR